MEAHENTRDLTILRLLQEREEEKLIEELDALFAIDIASLIRGLNKEEQLILFQSVKQQRRVEVFTLLPAKEQKMLLKALSSEKAAVLLAELPPEVRTPFLQHLPQPLIDALLKQLSEEERTDTLTHLGYPEGSIGHLMTSDYISVRMDCTIEEVLDKIQKYGHDGEAINVIYVVDEEETLLDDIKLKDILFVPRHAKVSSISDGKFLALSVYDNDETAVNAFKQNDRITLPVIDEEGTLLGIVAIDDVLRLANKEATEDIQKMGGTVALSEPYMQAPFFELMSKRARWLVILFIGEMFTATAMGYFADEIAKAVVLALFLPLIISSGGNAGSQASTLVVRAMALGEVKLKDWWKVFKREVLSGLFLGAILGFIGFFRVTIWSIFTNIYGEHWFMIAITIAISLIGVVLWGTLSGALLPLILRRIGVDPATSSAPFVATIVDVTGLVIYFLIAMHLLQGTVL